MDEIKNDISSINDEPEGFFFCEHCKRKCPDEHCFGLVQIDDDPTHAALWCIDCGDLLKNKPQNDKKQE